MAQKLLSTAAMHLRDSLVLTSLLLATACPASPAMCIWAPQNFNNGFALDLAYVDP